MAPKRTHTDPMADSVRRSCTPDPQEDSQRSREGLNLPPPAPLLQTTPQKERRESMQQQQGAGDGSANLRVLIARYKFIINDIMVALQTPTNLIMIDDVIALTEDSLRGFRTTKVDSRATLRRLQSNPLPLTRREEDTPATPPPAPDTEKVAVDHRAASPPPLAPADVSKPRSYMTALQGRTTVSPAKATRGASGKAQQELERRAQELTTEKVVESRDGSAVRGAERQRQADERRKELQDEKVKKIEEQTSKQLQAKQRRETAQEKLRTDTKERQESAQRRAEDAKTNVKDKAQRSNSRVDEVLLVNDLQQKNRQLKLEMKLSSEGDGLTTDQRREGASKQIKERNDSHTAEVEARQRDLSQQRAEKLVQRETQRQENLKRLEEQKKIDSDLKHQKVEEREKKVQLQQQAVQAEAEARKARTEERLSQSALHREEQREKQKQKSEKSDLKIREAKERREDASTPNAQSSAPPRATFTEVMPVLSAAEEEAVTQRLAKSQASMSRQAKTFLDNYQKESTLSAKDINKSRLRPLFGRLTVNALATSSRTALHDVATMELTDVDHEFMRHANGFETLVKLFLECRKSHDATILKLCSDVLHKFVMDSKEGHAHTKYFVRSGHLVSLIAGVYEEIKTLKKHNRSITLTTLLSLVSHCVGCVVSDVGPGAAAKDASSSSSNAGGIKLAPVRDQILTDLESIGLDRFCFAIATTCIDDDDMASLQYALLILYYHVMFLSKRKTEAAGTSWWVTTAITSLFTLLQNILTPGGLPLREKDVLSHSASCVIFTALRILSTISRWKLESIQDFLRGADVGATSTNSGNTAAPPMNSSMNSVESTASNHNMSGATRNELFHIVTSFFQYVATHDETLEHLPSASVDPATMEGSCLRSFTDALQFGMTLPSVPRTPLPTDCIAVASTSALDENSRTIQRGSFLRAGMHELLLLVGYITLGDSNSQEIFSWGKERPLLALMLSSLPMQYFAQARHILFPALLSILHRDDRNKIIASREMDLGALTQFLQEELDAVPPRLKQRAQAFHEAQELEAAMAASNKAKSPVKAQPIVAAIPKKSWIEIMNEDDDEDDFRIPSPGHPTGKHSAPAAAPSAVPAPVTTAPVEKSKALAEKERLAKAIKSMAPGLAHFRCDRRFPPSMWVDMLVFLNKPLPPPAPEL